MSNSIRLGHLKHLSVPRFRLRKGLPTPTTTGPLIDGPDWSYPDGTPGMMNKGQSLRYLRDQEFGRTMVNFNKQFKAIVETRRKKQGDEPKNVTKD